MLGVCHNDFCHILLIHLEPRSYPVPVWRLSPVDGHVVEELLDLPGLAGDAVVLQAGLEGLRGHVGLYHLGVAGYRLVLVYSVYRSNVSSSEIIKCLLPKREAGNGIVDT